MGNTYCAKAVADGLNLAIVTSRFNELVTKQLLDGALDALERHSNDECSVDVYWVPGCFELPAVTQRLCNTKRYDGVLVLGALIRGDTTHYDMLASEVTKGIANVSLHVDIPVSFGVLTCDTLEQALHRAGTKAGNKGAEAMITLIELVNLSVAIQHPEEAADQ